MSRLAWRLSNGTAGEWLYPHDQLAEAISNIVSADPSARILVDGKPLRGAA